MFSFAADLSNFHSVCVAKERALAEAQRRVKETEREIHKADLEIEDLAQAGNQYAKEAGGIAETLGTLTESLNTAKVMQMTYTEGDGEHSAPLRPFLRPQQMTEQEAKVAAFQGKISALAKGIAAVKAMGEKALADKAQAEAQLARAKAKRIAAQAEAAEATKVAEKNAAELLKEKQLAAELWKKVEEKRKAKSAVIDEIHTLTTRAKAAEEGIARAKAEAEKILKEAEAAAKAKVAAARAKASEAKQKLDKVKEETASIKKRREATKAKTAALKAETAELLAKKEAVAKKLEDEKKAVAAMAKKKKEAEARLAEKVKEREDCQEYAQKELAKIAEKRRLREAERPVLEQRIAAAEAAVAGQEARDMWVARVAAAVARDAEGGAAVDFGELQGEEAIPELRDQFVRWANARAALAAALEEKAVKEAVLAREDDEEAQEDGEDGAEGEDGDGPEAATLAAGEVALAKLEAQLAIKESAFKLSAQVLAGAGEGTRGGDEEEGGEESKGRDSVLEGEEVGRRASTEVRKVRFSKPLDNREETARLAAYRAECEEGCQQAVRALEQELKALDLAVAQQEEAVEREMAGKAAEVDEALAGLREEKAAVMRKLKELEA